MGGWVSVTANNYDLKASCREGERASLEGKRAGLLVLLLAERARYNSARSMCAVKGNLDRSL